MTHENLEHRDERATLTGLVYGIVEKEAPEEVAVVETIVDAYYRHDREIVLGSGENEKMFSFGMADLKEYLSLALLLMGNLSLLVMAEFIKQAIEKTAESSLESLAKRINEILSKLKNEKKKADTSRELDILIPVNWTEFERRIRTEGESAGLSVAQAREAANLTVRELTQDQVLLGDMYLTVLRRSSNENSQRSKK